MRYSQEDIFASVKMHPGDNNSAIEKLLNNEVNLVGNQESE
jgi:hypothetical protein